MEISFDRRNVSQCLQQRFTLPTYQRDYKWEPKHLLELMTDIQETFFTHYRPEHGRQAVAKYGPYFLGTIITTPSGEGQKAIVDGQQRITTLALIVSYFCRLSRDREDLKISDLSTLLRRKIYGGVEFNISFPPARQRLFEVLVDAPKIDEGDFEQLTDTVMSIPDLDDGSKRLFNLYGSIETAISDELDEKVLPYFVDYLTECVQLFEIGVPGEQDGHKVFVTMNDRGLKLGPIDLLKGFLLSNIPDNEGNIQAHEAWNECMRKLKAFDVDEDSVFFKAWLRGRFASTIRGKQKGASPGDFELIGDGYHRWVMDNRSLLGLETADDFFRFVTKTIPSYVSHYCSLKRAEVEFSDSYPHAYYNSARDFTLQSMVVLAAIDSDDQHSDVARKIRLVTAFLDWFATSRAISRQDNTYNNVRDPVFSLVKQIRSAPVVQLRGILKTEAAKLPIAIEDVAYWTQKNSDLLHLFARFASYLEDNLELTNKVGFPNYISRVRGVKTFDIEHVFSHSFEASKEAMGQHFDFKDPTQFSLARNTVGGMLLLTRGRNRSLQARPYSDKVKVYATESVLAQTLTQSFYTNNPAVSTRMQELGLAANAIEHFNLAAILERQGFYTEIAARVWDATMFDRF